MGYTHREFESIIKGKGDFYSWELFLIHCFLIWMQEDIVLCKIYRKATSLKVMEQRAAMEEESRMSHLTHSYSSPPIQESFSSHDTHQNFGSAMPPHDIVLKAEEEEDVVLTEEEQENRTACSSLGVATAKENLTELQLPKLHMDWTADPLWTLLRSPLLDNSSPYPMWWSGQHTQMCLGCPIGILEGERKEK